MYQAKKCPVCTGNAADDVEATPDSDSDGDGTVDVVDDVVSNAFDGSHDDVVSGGQTTDISVDVKVDESTTEIDRSTTQVNQGATIEDSVVSDSDIGSDEDGAETKDSIVRGSDGDENETAPRNTHSETNGAILSDESTDREFCTQCGELVARDATFCTSCGNERN
ncbi:hypothetical protein GCM10027355_36090 [Haloplanus salinarum]|uniref:zinc ribbon domain-containing protein n=1 Tax=Haloplanus salinarum TaxID=1912324 RepID=UPI003B435F6C